MRHLILLLFPLLLLAGCENMPTLGGGGEGQPAEVVEGSSAAGVPGEAESAAAAAETHGVSESAGLRGDELDNPDSPLANRVIYFDFDSSEIKAEYRPVVEAHAAYLAAHPETIVTLEGHTDERGSREYNLALGERRANAVRRQLVLLGASAGQIRVVSYGEERPVAEGHDEEAWALNRRVEIRY
ncbi:MAG: peptidoglycan-associated lipoprotein Pal [Gammaproteobacteria bacterium]|nr:MAG: peptidoglycan-associated lipoprotein Pal [Gammaproteobacteria bacterium]